MLSKSSQRWENIQLLFRSLLFYPRRGKANDCNRKPTRIAVVQMSKLGDMVCTTPMFRAIKSVHPESHLAVIGNKSNKELVSGNSDIDEYFVFDGKLDDMLKWLKRERFDHAFLTTPNLTLLSLLFLARVPCIVVPRVTGGFSSIETIGYKILRNFVVVQGHPMGAYAPREYLSRLEYAGIKSADTKKHLYRRSTDAKIDGLLKLHDGKLLVGISPTAGNKVKQWPPERFGEVADYLAQNHNAHVFILGGPHDHSEAQEMRSSMRHAEQLSDLTGDLSIDELKYFISKLDLFISVDTGPIYIAEAFGVPTIDIVGPMDEREQPPRGEKHRVVYLRDRKEPMLHIMNARIYDKKEARRQVEEITSKMVIDEVDSLVRSLRGERTYEA